jgi:hypothetical protein
MRAAPRTFAADSQMARDEIRVRMKELKDSRAESDISEYPALSLALADLCVMVSSFWKYSRVPAVSEHNGT